MGIATTTIKKKLFHMGELRTVEEIQENSPDQNTIIENAVILKKYEGFKGNKDAQYVPYNYKYNDKGWGCAWRAIQMTLSAYFRPEELVGKEGQIDFRKLFQQYGKKDRLSQIIDTLFDKNVAQTIKSSTYAPQQVSNNWAQPFICHLICKDKKINSRLLLLNDYPYANAPQQAFQPHKCTFNQFISLVDKHISSSPIMIDDGIISMSILAYKQGKQNSHELIIGDPHILSNKKNQLEVGIYKIVLNQKGEKIRQQINPDIFKQAYCDNMAKIDFSKKAWMLMFTDGKM